MENRSRLFKASTIVWAIVLVAIFVIFSRAFVMTGTKSNFKTISPGLQTAEPDPAATQTTP